MTFDFYFGAMATLLILSLLLFLFAAWKSPGGRLKEFAYRSEEDGSYEAIVKVRRPDPRGLWWRVAAYLFNSEGPKP
jgi:hypothetical protein